MEERPEVLHAALAPALRLEKGVTIDWRSPRAADGFKEYRDQAALKLVGCDPLRKRSLAAFWPARGPVWDALGITPRGEPIFVEAKAHIPEAASPGTRARPASRAKIEKALCETRARYAPRSKADWMGTFYQYCNRLAHHYLLRECNGIPSHLVFLYCINAHDVKGPTSVDAWRGAIQLLHAALGLPQRLPKGVHEVFLDVDELRDHSR